MLSKCYHCGKVRATRQAAEVGYQGEVRTHEIIMIDDPAGAQQRNPRKELLVGESNDDSVQNFALEPVFPDPVGALVSAESTIQLLA